MAYRVVMIGSGSRGNCLLVAGPQSRILIDMGFPQRRATAALADQGIDPCSLDAILVTHTHGDHCPDSALKFCWRNKVPLVSAADNLAVLRRRFRAVYGKLDRAGLVRDIPPRGYHIRGLDVRPFQVPHDADGLTLGYHLTLAGNGDAPLRVAAATDLGHVPPEVLRVLAQAEVLVLESNHDPEMLKASGRPPYLINRISGTCGHLSNGQTAKVIAQLLQRGEPGTLRRIVLAHLSQECNHPDVATEATAAVLQAWGDGAAGGNGHAAPHLAAATQDDPLIVLQ